jgi:asparagine synthase (glutamine-hydrolysing)
VCGIVGIIVRKSSLAPQVLERATLSLAHRGPDDSGTVILRADSPERMEVGLGNRRLAVLDLSPFGHQPMHDPMTGNWIVYNGEIYNFREIRARLEKEGVRFAGHSDTEVLLKSYGQWGERCLSELRGMFACAIWDTRRQRLLLARDPMGIKPLYYYESENNFAFASEVRTLLGTGLIPRKLDHAGLLSYLTFGSVYDPNTMIDGVTAMLPGHYLVWEQGKTRTVSYWDLVGEQQARPRTLDKPKFHTELCELLRESVRLQLVSDVPVGIFLSGGIDSSSLVALLSEEGVRLNTFSLVFREADYSEAQYSRLIAKKFRTEHQELSVSQGDVLDAIPSALQAMDQPTMDGINTFFISRQTRAAGIKVALSGLGGDEVFAGYSGFRTVPKMERLAQLLPFLPGFLRRALSSGIEHLAPETDQNRKVAALVTDSKRLIHPYLLSRMLFHPGQRDRLTKNIEPGETRRVNAPLKETLKRALPLDPINRVSYLESRCYMLNTLLRDSDVMSMAHGLEVRVPLVDHQLAERVLAVPGSWKLDAHTPKPLLVNSLHDLLPHEIVHRPKRGFTLPFEHWLRDEIRNEVEAGIVRIGVGPLAGALDAQSAQDVWSGFLAGKTNWVRPWTLYVLQRWCELNSVEV